MGRIFVSVHDAIFDKSNCFGHNASSLLIARSERIKWLVESKDLPQDVEEKKYQELSSEQQEMVDESMPFLFLVESDGGGDRNFMHLQNALADVALFVRSNCDKFVHYRCAAGHSYLNTSERGQQILNLALVNHTCCLDPDAPKFLTEDVLRGCASMKQVRKNIAAYDEQLPEAIRHIIHLRGDSNGPAEEPNEGGDSSQDDEQDNGSDDVETDVNEDDIQIGQRVKKFFPKMGWYNGSVTDVTGTGDEAVIDVKYDDEDTEKWTRSQWDEYSKADVPIGSIGWRFCEKFKGKGGKEVFVNATVVDIVDSEFGRTFECEYEDGECKMKDLDKLEKLATNNFGILAEDAPKDGDYYCSSEAEEDSDGDEPIKQKAAQGSTTGKKEIESNSSTFFDKLVKEDLKELMERGTARETFAEAVEDPMQQLRDKFGEMTLHGKSVKVHEWPKDDLLKELTDALLKIDPKYRSDVRSWKQLKSKMPELYEFIKTHCRWHLYLFEITLCDADDCMFCRVKIGRKVRTPVTKDGALRARVLAPMTRPVKSQVDVKHFMKPAEARMHTLDNNLSLEDLKKELDPLKSRPETKKEHEDDENKDREHEFRGNMVRDVVGCDECGFIRCIYSKYALGSGRNDGSKSDQMRRWDLLQDWKESGYVCGMAPPVVPYYMRRALRCWDAVEQQYYGGKRHDICARCCNDEDIWTPEEIKNHKNMNMAGKEPLPLCGVCVELNVQPPLKQGRATNFVEKGRQARSAKKKRRAQAVAKGHRKTGKKKSKRG